MIGGGSPTHMSRRGAQTMDVGVHRLLALSVTQPLDELVSRLNAFKPHFVNVYPSTAGLLADEQLAGRLHLRLRGLTTNSEPLTAELRERLEQAFDVRPTDLCDHRGPLGARVRRGLDAPVRRHVHRRERRR
jgi:phenylacetate-coenzyme A ligase PaaK-like adenylate-forming protein